MICNASFGLCKSAKSKNKQNISNAHPELFHASCLKQSENINLLTSPKVHSFPNKHNFFEVEFLLEKSVYRTLKNPKRIMYALPT